MRVLELAGECLNEQVTPQEWAEWPRVRGFTDNQSELEKQSIARTVWLFTEFRSARRSLGPLCASFAFCGGLKRTRDRNVSALTRLPPTPWILLLAHVANHLDVVAVGIKHERTAIGRRVFRAQALFKLARPAAALVELGSGERRKEQPLRADSSMSQENLPFDKSGR